MTSPRSAAQGRVEDSGPEEKTWGTRGPGEPGGPEGRRAGELRGRRREREERGVRGAGLGEVRREGKACPERGRGARARYLESNLWPSGKVPT